MNTPKQSVVSPPAKRTTNLLLANAILSFVASVITLVWLVIAIYAMTKVGMAFLVPFFMLFMIVPFLLITDGITLIAIRSRPRTWSTYYALSRLLLGTVVSVSMSHLADDASNALLMAMAAIAWGLLVGTTATMIYRQDRRRWTRITTILTTIVVMLSAGYTLVSQTGVIGTPAADKRYDDQIEYDFHLLEQDIFGMAMSNNNQYPAGDIQSITKAGDYAQEFKIYERADRYSYRVIPGTTPSYELCATFKTDTLKNSEPQDRTNSHYHPKGYYCFTFSTP